MHISGLNIPVIILTQCIDIGSRNLSLNYRKGEIYKTDRKLVNTFTEDSFSNKQ